MDKRKAGKLAQDLRDIIHKTEQTNNRPVAYMMVLWGGVWMLGFICSQFLELTPTRIIWAILNVLAIVLTIVITLRMYGKQASHNIKSLGPKVTLASIGISVITFMAAWMLELSQPREITLLIVLAAGISYFFVGIFTQIQKSFLGLGLVTATFLIDLFLPDWLYLGIGLAGGLVFTLSALSIFRESQSA